MNAPKEAVCFCNWYLNDSQAALNSFSCPCRDFQKEKRRYYTDCLDKFKVK